MKKLVHPNVVHLVEVIDAPAECSLYLVMEYVSRGPTMCQSGEDGHYLSPRTGESAGCLEAATAARYFVDILDGLEYLHLNCIAHRDLKPEASPHPSLCLILARNVLIGEDDKAKIADFGVSHYFHDEDSGGPKSSRILER
ncbi:unnamed protein product [Choristocarpus tenellus]